MSVRSPGKAWLLTAARNRRIDLRRSAAYRSTGSLDDASRGDTLPAVHMRDVDEIPDRRLALLFVCAHPAIDPAARTALMLQVVLGFEADRISHAFAMQPTAMAQRLVRAKRRIRDARIPFVVPEREQMQERLTPVLEAIYGAYAMDFPLVAGTTERESLADEALFLSSTLAELLPNEAEVLGLAALISLSLARRPAGGDGLSFVPLEEQDVSQWDEELIASGESYLYLASALKKPGCFQTEAAIQSVHCARARTGTTDWRTLRALYRYCWNWRQLSVRASRSPLRSGGLKVRVLASPVSRRLPAGPCCAFNPHGQHARICWKPPGSPRLLCQRLTVRLR